MPVSLTTTNKIFLVLGIMFELWFIIIHAIDYRYIYFTTGTATQQLLYTFFSLQGLIQVLFLLLLFFLGFTLVNTYVAGSAYSSALFSFLIIVFTVQYYFIIRSFWVGIGLGNDNYTRTLGGGSFNLIRIISTDNRLKSSYTTNVGFPDAIVCALSMLIAYMAIAGRVASFQIFIMMFFGVFFYSFNETVIWRHQISDNGYTFRLFLFGSTFGLVTALFLRFKDKIATTQSLGYFASRHTRTYGLIGAIFVWLFYPILPSLYQVNDAEFDGEVNFLFPSILTTWFALSASACASYCVSILLGRKIHPHDIVYSSFTGAIAWGATSALQPDPFPAILIGLITGLIVTLLNHKLKKSLNNPDVVDTHGTLFTFFTSAFIGGIYSAIMSPIGPFAVDQTTGTNVWTSPVNTKWLPSGRDRFQQGGYQLAGTFISIGIGALSSIAVGIIIYLTTNLNGQQVFNDATFTELTDEREEVIVKRNPVPA